MSSRDAESRLGSLRIAWASAQARYSGRTLRARLRALSLAFGALVCLAGCGDGPTEPKVVGPPPEAYRITEDSFDEGNLYFGRPKYLWLRRDDAGKDWLLTVGFAAPVPRVPQQLGVDAEVSAFYGGNYSTPDLIDSLHTFRVDRSGGTWSEGNAPGGFNGSNSPPAPDVIQDAGRTTITFYLPREHMPEHPSTLRFACSTEQRAGSSGVWHLDLVPGGVWP